MKTRFTLLAFFLLFATAYINAQCTYTPTITSPRLGTQFANTVVFCNDETETLSTQVYDSYQWYKQEWDWQSPNTNPWIAIPGATAQSLTINGIDDTIYNFKVKVSLNGCTAESSEITADGFVYSLPTMISTFTPGTFEQVQPGEYNICQGASVTFENSFNSLYGVHTWYKCLPETDNNNDPCVIAGVTGPSYTATTSGEYSFKACLQYCPNTCEYVGFFTKLNFGNWNFCTLGTSETNVKENNLKVYPNPTSQFLYIGKESDKKYDSISIMDMSGKIVLKKENHQYDKPIDVSQLSTGNYIIISKDLKGNIYKNKFIKK